MRHEVPPDQFGMVFVVFDEEDLDLLHHGGGQGFRQPQCSTMLAHGKMLSGLVIAGPAAIHEASKRSPRASPDTPAPSATISRMRAF
jgi:hypothetical protein